MAVHAHRQGVACSPPGSQHCSAAPCLQVLGAADEPGCGMASWWAEAQEIAPEDMQEG